MSGGTYYSLGVQALPAYYGAPSVTKLCFQGFFINFDVIYKLRCYFI